MNWIKLRVIDVKDNEFLKLKGKTFDCLLAIISFIILAISGEIMTKWIITLLLAIAFVIIGIIGIIDYKSQK